VVEVVVTDLLCWCSGLVSPELVFVAPTRYRWWFDALVMSDEVLVVRLPH
jgi:hypothetical protein